MSILETICSDTELEITLHAKLKDFFPDQTDDSPTRLYIKNKYYEHSLQWSCLSHVDESHESNPDARILAYPNADSVPPLDTLVKLFAPSKLKILVVSCTSGEGGEKENSSSKVSASGIVDITPEIIEHDIVVVNIMDDAQEDWFGKSFRFKLSPYFMEFL